MDNQSTSGLKPTPFRPQYPRKSLDPSVKRARSAQPSKPRPPFDPSKKIRISFEIYAEIAPALRSAVEEISNEIGGRLEGPHSFDREEALSDGAMALGALRSAVNAVVPADHPHWEK